MVGMVARDTPPAMDLASPPPVNDITLNTSIMPVTVPISPISGHIVTNTSIIGRVLRTSREILDTIMVRI